MNSAFEFIRDFKASDYGISIWHVGIAVVVFLLTWNLLIRAISFIKTPFASSVKRGVNVVYSVVVYGVFLMMMLHAYLNEEYVKLFVELLMMAVSRNLIGKFYDRYDKFVDEAADRTS